MEKQIIEILNLEILEPGTFISNTIMAAACFVFFSNLKKVSVTKFDKYLSNYFLYMALSGLTGAFAHSFYLYTGKFLHVITWIITGIAIYYIEYGLSPNLKQKDRFLNFAKIQLVLFIILVTFFQDFIVTKFNITLGLLGVVVPILLYRVFKYNEKHYLLSVLGISIAIVPALLHHLRFTFAGIFNMNDLSHFILIFSQLFLFLGLRIGITTTEEVYMEAQI
jgi:hypothetical protein